VNDLSCDMKWRRKVLRRKRRYCKTGLQPCKFKELETVPGVKGSYYVICRADVACSEQTFIPQTVRLE